MLASATSAGVNVASRVSGEVKSTWNQQVRPLSQLIANQIMAAEDNHTANCVKKNFNNIIIPPPVFLKGRLQ